MEIRRNLCLPVIILAISPAAAWFYQVNPYGPSRRTARRTQDPGRWDFQLESLAQQDWELTA